MTDKLEKFKVFSLASYYFLKRFLVKVNRYRKRRGPFELQDDKSANTKVVMEAAEKIGAQTRLLPGGYLEVKKGDITTYSYGSDFMFESVIATKICGDKYLTSLLLREAGIPVPDSESFSPFEPDKALSYFSAAKSKFVVKPRRSTSGGAGVTTEIESRKDFLRAFALAASYGKEVLVEEFVPGMNFRFLLFQGAVLSIVYRDRLHVIGDGSRSVDSLVDTDLRYNIGRPRPPRSRVLDNDALQHLRSKNVALSYVPKSGEKVYLKQMCNSGPIAEVRCDASRVIKDAALAAARVTGAKFCAVDIIAEGDICSQDPQTFYVNEVNTSPALFNNKEPRPDGSPDTSCTEIVLASLFPASSEEGGGAR